MHSHKVIIVDDQAPIRTAIRDALIQNVSPSAALDALVTGTPFVPSVRFDITEVAHGMGCVECVRRALAAGTPFVAAAIDMRMPGIDGLETIRRIREFDLNLNIVVMSAYTDYTDQEIMDVAISRVAFLPKPFEASQMRSMLLRACEEGL